MDENLATVRHKAEVISGINSSWLLTGGGNVEKFAYHMIDGKSAIIVKLGAPSFVNHFKMRLWDGDNRQVQKYDSQF